MPLTRSVSAQTSEEAKSLSARLTEVHFELDEVRTTSAAKEAAAASKADSMAEELRRISEMLQEAKEGGRPPRENRARRALTLTRAPAASEKHEADAAALIESLNNELRETAEQLERTKASAAAAPLACEGGC